MNIIFEEDCFETLQRNLFYDYVITSPPDFDEIGLEAEKHNDYKYFLGKRIGNLSPLTGYTTIIITDRKSDGKIVQKHSIIQDIMNSYGWNLVSQKIWVKSYKSNLYRLNYSHILTYHNPKINNKKLNPIFPDVFYFEHKSNGTYRNNFSKELLVPFIEAYTKPNDTVFDPFIGVGTTAVSCIETGRNFIGSEICNDVYKMCMDNINRAQNNTGIFSLG